MILVSGGAGYIGSHTCIELLAAGYKLLVLDNLSNSSIDSLERVGMITNVECMVVGDEGLFFPSGRNDESRYGDLVFVEGDVRDQVLLRRVFSKFKIEAVIHLAGLKAVGESVQQPLKYYDNNVSGSVALFEIMVEFCCKRLVFSSSATVYGDPTKVPIREDFPLSTTNPYGASKLAVEGVLHDLYASDQDWSVTILRYFNPVGAHRSGLIGENPNGIPNNLMPFVSQVAVGQREKVSVFGNDYETHDGTGVRDYIHVVDLAKGHLKALLVLQRNPGLITVNLGTGHGYSVLEMIDAFEKASGKIIPYEVVERRPGDISKCYADPSYAQQVLEWSAELSLDQMCKDAWRWQSMNPKGYGN